MKRVFILLSAISLFYTANAFADIQGHNIPASMCQPYPGSADKLSLTSNGWYFTGSNTGYAYLYCPIPLNAWGGNAGLNNDIYTYRVYYRDSDGSGSNAQIATYLIRANSTGSVYWSDYFSSNNFSTTTHTVAPKYGVGKDLYLDGTNGFYVRMYRQSTSEYPKFQGIDFVTPIL